MGQQQRLREDAADRPVTCGDAFTANVFAQQ
jgi:hypothetical protein